MSRFEDDDLEPAGRPSRKALRRKSRPGPRFRVGARVRVTVTEAMTEDLGVGSYAGVVTDRVPECDPDPDDDGHCSAPRSGAAWEVELDVPSGRTLVLCESEMEVL